MKGSEKFNTPRNLVAYREFEPLTQLLIIFTDRNQAKTVAPKTQKYYKN